MYMVQRLIYKSHALGFESVSLLSILWAKVKAQIYVVDHRGAESQGNMAKSGLQDICQR